MASRGEAGRSPGGAQIAAKTRGAQEVMSKLEVGSVEGIMRQGSVGPGRRGR
jgi:hypothetical protein